MSLLALLVLVMPPQKEAPPPAPRELRAAWVATVDNVDWPSKKGLPVEQQKRELTAIVDTAAGLHLNALLFQVRPECDALYPSELEPWSEYLCGVQGKAPVPLWDPLRALIDAAHDHGIQVHAWINPFRARAGAAESKPDPRHISQAHKELVYQYGKHAWCDPGRVEVQQQALKVVADLVHRYDLDGVCVDDYFYPYPVKGQEFPDQATYARYAARGGKLGLGAWRRENVDRFVEALQAVVRKERPFALIGISPFGIARPKTPPGIEAGIDQFEELHADVRKWLAQGWCDWFMPQLYWPIAQKAQAYPTLLSWWATQNPLQRVLAPANFTSKVGGAWKAEELLEQIRVTRATKGAAGNVHFSMKAFLRDSGAITRLLGQGLYASPALPPPAPWLDPKSPAAPTFDVQGAKGELRVSWSEVKEARWFAISAQVRGRWELVEVVPASRRAAVVRGERAWVRAISATGIESSR